MRKTGEDEVEERVVKSKEKKILADAVTAKVSRASGLFSYRFIIANDSRLMPPQHLEVELSHQLTLRFTFLTYIRSSSHTQLQHLLSSSDCPL